MSKLNLFEALYTFLLPTLGFVGGLLWRKILEAWRFLGARAQYEYHRQYLPSDIVITLDSAIPSFELDGQSIAPTEEKFFLRPLAGIGLENHNAEVASYHKKPPFVFGSDEVFGSNKLSKLEKITGIKGLAQRIEQAREKISYEFLNKQKGSYFNGKKMGLRNFNFSRVGDDERSRLDIRVYETDYFTHKVMQQVVREHLQENPEFIQTVESNTSLLNSHYYPLTTSIGLNLFLFSDLKRKLVFSRRAAMASDGNQGAGKLHVAMNEGLSHTDFEFQQRGEGQLSLINCFRRGMQEELGFNEYDERLGSLNVFDCFLVKESFQFGLFAWASYNGYFEEIANHRAQDKAMESSELLALDFNGRAMRQYISDTLFVSYTRVGLEGLCSIHGINTNKIDKKSWQYRKTWLKVAGKGLWRRVKSVPKTKPISS